jgi:hypothetical protein
MSTVDTIKKVMKDWPDLSSNGFRCSERRLGYPDRHDEWRVWMLREHEVGQFVRATEYLATRRKRKLVDRGGRSSYGWKHRAESWHKDRHPGADYYISNGMFIAAAIAAGFEIFRPPGYGGPNCLFNISRK